jgi:hypothetical protein
MVCFAEPGLTEDLYIVHKEEFSIMCFICNTYNYQRLSLFIRGSPILLLERMAQKDCDHKGSVARGKSLWL